MVVWGAGDTSGAVANGARYNPTGDTWTPVANTGAPHSRFLHTAVWTGTEMIVWGGTDSTSDGVNLWSSSRRYSPATDSWTPVTISGAAASRSRHTAIWTGNEMLVWGGQGGNGPLRDTGSYQPHQLLYLYLKP